jgi:hypothetical protein
LDISYQFTDRDPLGERAQAHARTEPNPPITRQTKNRPREPGDFREIKLTPTGSEQGSESRKQ